MISLSIIFSSCINDQTITKKISTSSNEKIDSTQKRTISGVWNLDDEVYNKELYLFKDNTWKVIATTSEYDTIIRKGKYTIAKDSAVFFRHFGSQHSPYKDTINDYKTSLGAFVLFFNEQGELKDNQGDYIQTYKKIK